MQRKIPKGFEPDPAEVLNNKDPIKESKTVFEREMRQHFDNLNKAYSENQKDHTKGINQKQFKEWEKKLTDVVQIDTEIRELIRAVHEGANDGSTDQEFDERKAKLLTKVNELHNYINNAGFFNVDRNFNTINQGRTLWSKHHPYTAERFANEHGGVTMESTLGGQLFTNQKNWGLEYVAGTETTPGRCFWAGMSKHAANLLKETVHIYIYANPIPGTSLTDDELKPLFKKMREGEVKKVKIHIADPIDIDERLPIYLSTDDKPFPQTGKEYYIVNPDTLKVSRVSSKGEATILPELPGNEMQEKRIQVKTVFNNLADKGLLKMNTELKGGGRAIQAAHLLIACCEGQYVGRHLVERKVVQVTTEKDIQALLRKADPAYHAGRYIAYNAGEQKFKEEIEKSPSVRKPIREVSIDPKDTTIKPAPWLQQSLFNKSTPELRIASKDLNVAQRESKQTREARIKETFNTNKEHYNKPQVFLKPTSLTVNPSDDKDIQVIVTLSGGQRIGVNVNLGQDSETKTFENISTALVAGLEEIKKSSGNLNNIRIDIFHKGSKKFNVPNMVQKAADFLEDKLHSYGNVEVYTHAFPRKKVDNKVVHEKVVMEDKQTPQYAPDRPKL